MTEIGLVSSGPAAVGPMGVEGKSTDATREKDGAFASVLERYIRGLDETLKQGEESTLRLLAGEDIDLHSVVIAQERAALELSLAIQVRNKIIEAYQEIMRMQV